MIRAPLGALRRAVAPRLKALPPVSALLTSLEVGLRNLNHRLAPAPRPARPLDAEQRRWLAALRRDGIVAIPGYLSPERCVALRAEVDRLMDADPSTAPNVWVDPERSDHRLYGVERVSAALADFHGDPRLHAVGEAYVRARLTAGFTVAGRVDAVSGGRGSGAGWHRDSFTQPFKALLYLDDVDAEGGPFETVGGTASLRGMLELASRAGVRFRDNRYDDARLAHIVERLGPGHAVRTPVGRQGLLVLVDSRGLHRGRPVVSGRRYTLTTYWFPVRAVRRTLVTHFRTVVPFADGVPPTRERLLGGAE